MRYFGKYIKVRIERLTEVFQVSEQIDRISLLNNENLKKGESTEGFFGNL